MDNLFKASQHIKTYFQEKVLHNYSLNVWKETLLLKKIDSKAMLEKWSVLGAHFVPTYVEPDIICGDEWTPSLMLQYMWRVQGTEIPVRITIFRDEVKFVEICDMFKVAEHFGDTFDFIDEFKKTVELMLALSKKH